MTKNKKICDIHNALDQDRKNTIQRIHDRIDGAEADMNKVKVSLWGDPEKNIIGFFQLNEGFKAEIKIYARILSTIGGAIVVALIAVVIKIWFIK